MSPSSYRHITEDKQFTEHEDLRVERMFFHRPSIASTYDSAESIVTPPPDSDLDDEQIRALLAVQFISRSDECRETRRVVVKQKQVESRNVFG